MNASIKAARNGSTPSQIPAETPSEGLDKLRREEATSLISLINEAICRRTSWRAGPGTGWRAEADGAGVAEGVGGEVRVTSRRAILICPELSGQLIYG